MTPDMTDDDLNWRVEALCTGARPPLRREIVEGWAMGQSGGRMRQANCVNPLRGPRGDPRRAVERGEAFYEACGQTPIFRIPQIAGEMDDELDRLGYGVEGDTVTLFNSLEMHAVVSAETTLLSHPDEEWPAVRQRNSGDGPLDHAAYRAMIEAVALPKIFAATRVGDAVASIAYGVVSDGLLAVEGVATLAEFRGRGLSRTTLHALIAWARTAGAAAACLQVQMDNAPARALYASLGFGRELYRYHYRRKPA